jgi:aryl-alcohol dehydrogenase-like predicted oxidoreductase
MSQTAATLITRQLGRTQRFVTTFGLGGQASLMLALPGVDPIEVITKAFQLGITYFDTSNAYGPSQAHYGTAFRRLGLTPGSANYDLRARERIYLASKTHMRTTRHPTGQPWRSDYSDGMSEGVSTATDDVRRSLSIIFGDGTGRYPENAYLDCIQIHNITAQDDVDMIYEGLDAPDPNAAWLGALAGLLDIREGSNRSGANPKRERLVRHIGITGHYNAAALMYAIRRDSPRILDTLLVALNPSSAGFFDHRYNSVPVAAAAGMGIIAMKVFLDAVYYGEPATFVRSPQSVCQRVGTTPVSSEELIQYALSIPGVTACLTGIGKIDASDDPAKCQLAANLTAAQLKTPLSSAVMFDIEARIAAAGLGKNEYLQRLSVGLTPPRNVGAESDTAGFSPSTPEPRPAIRISWDTAYAGTAPLVRYDVLRDGIVIGSVPHQPQYSCRRFVFEDVFQALPLDAAGAAPARDPLAEGEVGSGPGWTQQRSSHEEIPHVAAVGRYTYLVRSIDALNHFADSVPIEAAP